MAWKKGGVVVVKCGDPDISAVISDSILGRRLESVKRERDIQAISYRRFWEERIAEAYEKYHIDKKTPLILRKLKELAAFPVYVFSIFATKTRCLMKTEKVYHRI